MLQQLKKIFVTIIVLTGVMNAVAGSAPFIEVDIHEQNLDAAKQRLTLYRQDGSHSRYMDDVKKTMALAKQQFDSVLLQLPSSVKPAIVFDIDDTATSTWPYLEKYNFGFSSGSFNSWVRQANAPAITPTLEFYNYVKAQGTTLFFITNRAKTLEHSTRINLARAGYKGYQRVYLNPNTAQLNSAKFKSLTRKAIEDMGYTIILDIGDQYSDLCGGHAQSFVKLPNPYYFVPGCASIS